MHSYLLERLSQVDATAAPPVTDTSDDEFAPASAKKKKVKTTFKALKCSACKAVAEEIKQEVVAAVSLRRMSSPALILAFTSDCDILCR